MERDEFLEIAKRLMRHEAAPYHESLIQEEIRRVCKEHRISLREDRFGNLMAELNRGKKVRPMALAAHMDHPGFEVLRRVGDWDYELIFRGGVPDRYFKSGARVLLMPGRRRATVLKPLGDKKVVVRAAGKKASSEFRYAVWDLPAHSVKGGRIAGRACDDLIGVACALAVLIDAKRTGAAVNLLGLFTRAEEVGFQGALALATSGALSKEALVVSLETSQERPPVKMGKGPIVRVGDKTSLFDSEATRFLTEVAGDIQKEDRSFTWQRALMSGGACEATAYQEYGYTVAATCVALGAYHNCGDKSVVAPEFVSWKDALGMVRLLSGAATRMNEYTTLTGRLGKRLEALRVEGMQRLKS